MSRQSRTTQRLVSWSGYLTVLTCFVLAAGSNAQAAPVTTLKPANAVLHEELSAVVRELGDGRLLGKWVNGAPLKVPVVAVTNREKQAFMQHMADASGKALKDASSFAFSAPVAVAFLPKNAVAFQSPIESLSRFAITVALTASAFLGNAARNAPNDVRHHCHLIPFWNTVHA